MVEIQLVLLGDFDVEFDRSDDDVVRHRASADEFIQSHRCINNLNIPPRLCYHVAYVSIDDP